MDAGGRAVYCCLSQLLCYNNDIQYRAKATKKKRKQTNKQTKNQPLKIEHNKQI